jgi:DNA-binding transcriptional LysR family regulator
LICIKRRALGAALAMPGSIRPREAKINRPILMVAMSHFDHSDLDGRLLQLLLAVIEEQSVTRAALRLGVTQSAVSHLLDKLRAIVGDPLFVRSGRGIVATARAEALAVHARVLLDDMRRFSTAAVFDPATLSTCITIAGNELQRDVLFPSLLARLRAKAPGITMRVIPSGAPRAELLRDAACDLIVTPRPPDAADLMQKRLFEDRYCVYFDAATRAAPATLDEYLAAGHATVLHEPRRELDVDRHLAEQGVQRRFVVRVPGFSGIAPFLRGTELLATLPSLLQRHVLNGFATAPVPVACPAMPMYMVWHLRHQEDLLHLWLRAELEAVARAV